MLSRPTWMRSARSGSSLMQKMPRLRARDQAVVDRQLVREVAALGDLDRVDLADQVGDGDVRRRQLLAVALLARRSSRSACRRPARRCGRAAAPQIGSNGSSLISQPATIGHLLVEQVDQAARDARLRLAALAEQDDVLAGEDRVLELRDDGLLVADDAGEHLFAVAHLAHQVAAHLLLDGEHVVAALAKLADGCGFCTLPCDWVTPSSDFVKRYERRRGDEWPGGGRKCRRGSIPAADEIFDVGEALAWIGSQSGYCTPERKRRVPDKWAGTRLHRWRLRPQRHMMSGARTNR